MSGSAADKDRVPDEAEELAELIGILRELNAAYDPSGRLATVVMRSARALGAESGSLFLLDGEPPHLQARVLNQPATGLIPEAGGADVPSPSLIIAPDQGTVGWVVVHGRSLRLDDAQADPRFVSYTEPYSRTIRNLLSVPLRADGGILGALDVVNRAGGFDDAAEAFLSAVADELAIAIKNSLLVRSLEKEKLALEVMREVSHTLLSTLHVDEVLERIVVGLGRLVAYDAVGIFLVGEDGAIEHAIDRGYRVENFDRVRQKVGEGIIGWSISTGKTAIVPDVLVDNRYINARSRTRSEMVAPLVSRDRVIGAFNLESDQLAAYNVEDLSRLRSFADSAAVAIEVARLHEEAVRARRLDEDLAIAREIQLSFLPRAAWGATSTASWMWCRDSSGWRSGMWRARGSRRG
jgi:GAF domain-containing protein